VCRSFASLWKATYNRPLLFYMLDGSAVHSGLGSNMWALWDVDVVEIAYLSAS